MSERGLYMKGTDFKKLEESIRSRLRIEIFHIIHLMLDKIYFTKYVERNYKIWKELKDI